MGKKNQGHSRKEESPFFVPNVLFHRQKTILSKPPRRDKFRVTMTGCGASSGNTKV